jgi:hypothetical protein
MKTACFILFVVALWCAPLHADVLWYNGDADGVDSYLNQNDDNYSSIIYNDFTTTECWVIQSVWSDDIFGNGPPNSTDATWQIWTDLPDGGTLIASGDGPATLTPTGFSVFGDAEYQVLVSGLSVLLAPGTYWLAVFPDCANGGSVGNDTTSGDNAIGTPPGDNGNLYYSPDGGNTFIGPSPVDTVAGIAGIDLIASVDAPEPSGAVLCATAFLLALALGVKARADA